MSHINCRWLQDGKIVVNPDGQVYPCCYFANYNYIETHKNKEIWEHRKQNETTQELMKQYDDSKDDLNVNKKTIKEILSHDWFFNKLPDSWKEQNSRHEICIRFCQQDD